MEENTQNAGPEEAKREIKRTVTMRGRELTLLGEEIKPGAEAPDFKVTANDMLPMKFKRTYKGKVTLISAVPSLDTPVCDLQTRRFNQEALNLSPDIEVITISMDLPFAQKRWCGAAGVNRVKTYSDYLKGDFGKSYGVLIKELRLLARTIFIVDREGTVKYVQLVKELSNEPNYEEAINALKEIIKQG